MAVHCGVCGTRLSDAGENDGSFQIGPGFNGWNVREGETHARIEDTCGSCAKALREAVTKTANEIAAKHRVSIDKLRNEIKAAREHTAKVKKEKADFEREWAARQAGR